MHMRNAPSGRWKKGQEGSKGEHYPEGGLVLVDLTVVEGRNSIDAEPAALHAKYEKTSICVTFHRGGGT